MSLMGSFYTGVSGLQVSQRGLNTTAHNLSAEYIMGNARLDESQAGIKMPREISTASDMQMITL